MLDVYSLNIRRNETTDIHHNRLVRGSFFIGVKIWLRSSTEYRSTTNSIGTWQWPNSNESINFISINQTYALSHTRCIQASTNVLALGLMWHRIDSIKRITSLRLSHMQHWLRQAQSQSQGQLMGIFRGLFVPLKNRPMSIDKANYRLFSTMMIITIQ